MLVDYQKEPLKGKYFAREGMILAGVKEEER